MSVTIDSGNLRAATALIEHIHRVRDAACKAHLDQAHAERERIIKEAHRRARAHMRKVVTAERDQRESALRRNRAQGDSLVREKLHRIQAGVLTRVFGLLQVALHERWSNKQTRQSWLRMVLQLADSRFMAGKYRLEYAPRWSPAEGRRLFADFRNARPDVKLETALNRELGSGFRLTAENICLDASPGGLLARRRRIESLLLGAMENVWRSKARTPALRASGAEGKEANRDD